MIELNGTAAEVLGMTLEPIYIYELISQLSEKYQDKMLALDVIAFIECAVQERWLEYV